MACIFVSLVYIFNLTNCLQEVRCSVRWGDLLGLQFMKRMKDNERYGLQLSMMRLDMIKASGLETEYTRSGEFTTFTF